MLQFEAQWITNLTLSWRRSLSYGNQSIDSLRKSIDWFLYDNDLRYERVKYSLKNVTFATFALQFKWNSVRWTFH